MSTNLQMTNTSPAAASTAAGVNIITGLAGYRSMRIEANLVGATGGTLDVYLQVSYDGGATWTDYTHFTQLAAGGAAIKWGVSVTRDNGSALATPGKDLTPTLAANTSRDGEWGDRMRMVFVAGVSTSAGAAQTVKVFLSK